MNSCCSSFTITSPTPYYYNNNNYYYYYYTQQHSCSSPSGSLVKQLQSVRCYNGQRNHYQVRRSRRITKKVYAVATTPAVAEETKECLLPTWAAFDLGRAPVYWKTSNGRPPSSGEQLIMFYNPEASKLDPNPEFGIAFNGGFNQPIMCGGEPREMTRRDRGKADLPFYTITICIPQHAVNLIFSFTNGVDWDGPYKLQFEVPKRWRNKPISFFNEGLAEELSKIDACQQAIFPDARLVSTQCTMIANLSVEGGDRCNLDLVSGCTDPSSPQFNPLANVDDGSCPIDVDGEGQ